MTQDVPHQILLKAFDWTTCPCARHHRSLEFVVKLLQDLEMSDGKHNNHISSIMRP